MFAPKENRAPSEGPRLPSSPVTGPLFRRKEIPMKAGAPSHPCHDPLPRAILHSDVVLQLPARSQRLLLGLIRQMTLVANLSVPLSFPKDRSDLQRKTQAMLSTLQRKHMVNTRTQRWTHQRARLGGRCCWFCMHMGMCQTQLIPKLRLSC